MRYWVQFLQESTGYIAGTIPPQFGAKTLIDATGTDGVYILDGRNSEQTMHRDAKRKAARMEHFKKYPAYVICKGQRLFEETKRTAVQTLNYPIGPI